jgi:succinate dehydrogenase/fumarate reductase flavoprotein subunit
MWHFHGSYGFKFPEYPFAFRTCLRGSRSSTVRIPWILVDRRGRRFANEFPPAVQDTGARDLDLFDPDTFDYPRIPSFLVFDDAGRRLGPLADVTINDEGFSCAWSSDNLAEVARGWIHQCDSLQQLASRLGVSSETLQETVAAWNELCRLGRDLAFGRLPSSMCPIVEPPYYGVPVWPIITNTQGGPAHDAEQRVLDAFGRPIPGLYAAGELGSLYGSIYQLAGNITECFVGGRIAGHNAAVERPGM